MTPQNKRPRVSSMGSTRYKRCHHTAPGASDHALSLSVNMSPDCTLIFCICFLTTSNSAANLLFSSDKEPTPSSPAGHAEFPSPTTSPIMEAPFPRTLSKRGYPTSILNMISIVASTAAETPCAFVIVTPPERSAQFNSGPLWRHHFAEEGYFTWE